MHGHVNNKHLFIATEFPLTSFTLHISNEAYQLPFQDFTSSVSDLTGLDSTTCTDS